ncbi:hypothetical protein [Nocardiopsis halotolerans]|uniref:hypothetical protein n=1 Tax=Nocardiopsis halotolerans TaxID=124252 RepID=UPI00034C909B|nr:hypothetical protein [Nocardiopsis halotolerans]
MSRTDRTKPLWVRCAEHDPRPMHDHRHGSCDLPPKPTREKLDTHCWWLFDRFGSPCCAGDHGRAAKREMGELNRASNRRDRHRARLEARRLVTGGDVD